MNKREKDEDRQRLDDQAHYAEIEDYDIGEWISCWHCHGAGQFDEADYDGVNYAPGEEIETCPECNGRGGWRV